MDRRGLKFLGHGLPDTLHRQPPGKTALAVDVDQGRGVGEGAEQGGLGQPGAPGVLQDVDISDGHPAGEGGLQGQSQGLGLELQADLVQGIAVMVVAVAMVMAAAAAGATALGRGRGGVVDGDVDDGVGQSREPRVLGIILIV